MKEETLIKIAGLLRKLSDTIYEETAVTIDKDGGNCPKCGMYSDNYGCHNEGFCVDPDDGRLGCHRLVIYK